MLSFTSKEYPGIAVAVFDLSYYSSLEIEGSDGYYAVTTLVGGPESIKCDFSGETLDEAIEKAWTTAKRDWETFGNGES